MSDIATRAERGDDAGELLRELALIVKPCWYQTERPLEAVVEYVNWCKLVEINTPEAHLAAAMMLVPDGEGHDPFWLLKGCNPNNRSRGCRAEIWIKNSHRPLRGSGPTPAHALIAAIARSMEHGD
jgi:hypothetical protein